MGYGNVAPAPVMSTASAEWLATPTAISSSVKRSRNAEKYTATLHRHTKEWNIAAHTTGSVLQLRYGSQKRNLSLLQRLKCECRKRTPTSAVVLERNR